MSRLRQRPDPVVVRTLAMGYSSGYRIAPHAHEWHQLIYASEGVMGVTTPDGAWFVPPQRAVWVPSGVEHAVEMSGSVSMRTLYFRRGAARELPDRCAVLTVSPLLRELVLRAVEIGALDRSVPVQARLIAVILDQLRALPVAPLQLPTPREARARRLAEALERDPGGRRSLADLARTAGASKRTLERSFRSETGMSLGRWRQQLRLLQAMRAMAGGTSVTAAALEVGYDSTSAFIHAFRRAFGTTPRRYFAPGA